MDNKDSFEFDFDDKIENVISSAKKQDSDEYEDIVSDSGLRGGKHVYEDISSNSRKKMNVWAKTAIIAGTSLFLVIVLFVSWLFIKFDYNYNEITTNPEELGFAGVKDEKVINIALFGVDSRDENAFKGNTDSIMILSLNTNTKKVKIISIMRDTLVPMNYKGKEYFGKINSAYSKGPEHAIKTLNQNFDLDISEYATVNFFGMTDIIDAVGGITATITKDELTWKGHGNPNLNNCMDEICREMGLNPKNYYIKRAGEQTLNGVQAVAYARVRHCTSVWGTRDDYGRTDRQRHVMQELFNKAIKMETSQYVSLIEALIPCSETSLSYSDIIGLATNILLDSPSFEQYRLPPAEYQSKFTMKGPSGYGSIIYYDLDYAARLVNGIIYDDLTIEKFVESNPIEYNDWYYEMTGTNGKNTTTSSSTTSSATNNTSSTQSTSSEVTSEDVSSEEPTEEDPVESTPNEEDPDKDPSEEDSDNTSSDNTSSEDADNTSSNDTPAEDGDNTSSGETPSNPEDSSSGNVSSTPENPSENTSSKKPYRKR